MLKTPTPAHPLAQREATASAGRRFYRPLTLSAGAEGEPDYQSQFGMPPRPGHTERSDLCALPVIVMEPATRPERRGGASGTTAPTTIPGGPPSARAAPRPCARVGRVL